MRLNVVILLAGAALWIGGSGPVAATTFDSPQTYSMPVWPDAWPDVATIADINGDGRKDAVIATTVTDQGFHPDNDWRLFIFLQQADGSLGAPIRIAYSSSADEGDYVRGIRKRTSITTADLNGDGIDDIIVGRRGGLSVVYGNRTSALAATLVNNATGYRSGDAIAIRDFDGDGQQDIAAQNETGGENGYGITVYFGDPTGSFARQRYMATLSEGGVELKSGDLNGDHKPDLVVSWFQGLSNGAEIFLNDGNGWFGAGKYIPKPPQIISTYTVSVGDFDGDGLDDMVLGGSDWDFDSKKVFLYKQWPLGQLSAPVLLQAASPPGGDIPDSSISFDVDGDQRDDLLLMRSGGVLGYFEQRSGHLGLEQLVSGPYLTWSGNQPISAGDINGDHCTDVIAANYNYGLVVWHGRDCSIVRHDSAPLVPPKIAGVSSALVSMKAPKDRVFPSNQPVRQRMANVENTRRGGQRLWYVLVFLLLGSGLRISRVRRN